MPFPLFLMLAALLPAMSAAQTSGAAMPAKRPFWTDLQTSSGIAAITGTALDPGEENIIGFSRIETRLVASLGGPVAVQLDFRFFDAANHGGTDSYNRSILGAAHIMRQTEGGYFGAFADGVHTEQSLLRKNSSRRFFYGLEAAHTNGPDMTSSAQIGYLFHTGGLDGRGKDSITDAVFAQITARARVSKHTFLNMGIAAATGIMDFDMIAPSNVQALNASLGLTHQFAKQRGHFLASLEYTSFARSGSNLQETRASIGWYFPLGKQSQPNSRFGQPLAPLSRWVAHSGGPMP